MNPDDQTPTPHRNIPWLTLALIALAVISYVFISRPPQGVVTPIEMMRGGVTSGSPIVPKTVQAPTNDVMMAEGQAGTQNSAMMRAPGYYPQPYQNPTPSITDTREFLKMNYKAQMRTRNVQELTKRVETTVRGYDGRVDETSSSQKFGYVNFVVPASKFDEFRTEIEAFVGPRFLTVSVRSENLLPQKQSIEGQQKQVETSLADLQTSRTKLVAAHKSTLASLNSQLDDVVTEITALRGQTSDPNLQAQIAARLLVLQAQQGTFHGRIANENSSYKYQLDSIDAQIKYANSNLDSVKTQDQDLLDNVATVNGTISINWISLFEIVQLYLPGNSIPVIFVGLAVLAYVWHRFREHRVLGKA